MKFSDVYSPPKWGEMLPPQFKRPSGGGGNLVERHEVDPVLLSGYLMELLEEKMAHYDGWDIEQFKEERRFEDIFFDRDISIEHKEVFKGYLGFKGTIDDLIYTLRLFDIDLRINQVVKSGLIDPSNGRFKYNNSEPVTQFTNPDNTYQFTQNALDQDFEDAGMLTFEVDVNIANIDTQRVNKILDVVSLLSLNRLAMTTYVGSIIFNYIVREQVPDELDENLPMTINVALADKAYATVRFNNSSPELTYSADTSGKFGSGLAEDVEIIDVDS